MKGLFFWLALLTLSLCQQSQLLKLTETALSVPTGFVLIQMVVYENSIYAVVGKITGFYIINYDWTNNYTIIAQGPAISAFVDVTLRSIRNPTITVDSAKIGVLYYLSAADDTTNQKIINRTNLNQMTTGIARSFCYTSMRLTLIDAYYIKSDTGF
jgi:uncharacterized protein YtpQ (UPF0354 family)